MGLVLDDFVVLDLVIVMPDFDLPVEVLGEVFGFPEGNSALAPGRSEAREGNRFRQFSFPITAYWAIVNTLLTRKYNASPEEKEYASQPIRKGI